MWTVLLVFSLVLFSSPPPPPTNSISSCIILLLVKITRPLLRFVPCMWNIFTLHSFFHIMDSTIIYIHFLLTCHVYLMLSQVTEYFLFSLLFIPRLHIVCSPLDHYHYIHIIDQVSLSVRDSFVQQRGRRLEVYLLFRLSPTTLFYLLVSGGVRRCFVCGVDSSPPLLFLNYSPPLPPPPTPLAASRDGWNTASRTAWTFPSLVFVLFCLFYLHSCTGALGEGVGESLGRVGVGWGGGYFWIF